MADYDFSTLDDKDLEALSRDLLNKKYGLKLQDFRTGRDGGIDLRYAGDGPAPKIIAQVKHYLGSGVTKLKHDLLAEYEKVSPLNPEKYLVVTSVSLSAKDKDDMVKASKGLIKQPDDVFGQEDLNALLREFGDVLKSWYKLWLTNTEVLSRILNNASYTRSDFTIETIQKRVKIYVETQDFNEALDILFEQKVLMITGVPGIGKTTIAEMIVYHILEKGHELISVANIDEAEARFSADPKSKQLFYFDDFLGANFLEFTSAAGKASRIALFIERIRNSHNKFMLLTTRTVILNKMRQLSDKIERLGLKNNEYEIQLTSYSDFDKARILYKHMYFSELDRELLNVIFHERFYMRIIKHKNYSPRIVEYITNKKIVHGLSPAQFRAQVVSSLDVPDEIWRHSFETQIEEAHRAFLFTLFTFKGYAEESLVNKAYLARLEYERTVSGLAFEGNVIDSTVRILQGGFIDVLYDQSQKQRYYRYVNPSLADFIGRVVVGNEVYLTATVHSAVSLQQLEKLNPILMGFTFSPKTQEYLVTAIPSIEHATPSNRDAIDIILLRMEMLLDYCPDVERGDLLVKLWDAIPKQSGEGSFDSIRGILSSAYKCTALEEHLRRNSVDIISWILNRANSFEDLDTIKTLFDDTMISPEDYLRVPEQRTHMETVIKRIVSEEEQVFFDDQRGSVFSEDDFFNLQKDFKKSGGGVVDALLPENTIDWDGMGDKRNWDEIIEENQIANAEAQAAHEMHKDIDATHRGLDEQIHQLFS